MLVSTRPLMRYLVPVALIVGPLGLSVASAQSPSPPAAQPQAPNSPNQSQKAPDLSDKKLDAAAAALKQVAGIKDDYQKKIESAAAPEKKRLADEANQALVKAVTDQGLSVEEYTVILVAAQNDPKVREKIIQRINPSAD